VSRRQGRMVIFTTRLSNAKTPAAGTSTASPPCRLVDLRGGLGALVRTPDPSADQCFPTFPAHQGTGMSLPLRTRSYLLMFGLTAASSGAYPSADASPR
jgi:hypothetical protein